MNIHSDESFDQPASRLQPPSVFAEKITAELDSPLDGLELQRVLKLYMHVPEGSMLHDTAKKLLYGERITLSSIVPLQSLLLPGMGRFRNRWRERALAAWCLSHAQLTPEQQQAVEATLLQTLSGELADSETFNTLRLLLTALPAAIVLKLISGSPIYFLNDMMAFYPIALAGTAFCMMMKRRREEAAVQTEAAYALGKLKHTVCLHYLVQHALLATSPLYPGREKSRKAARSALTSVLEAVSEDYYGNMSASLRSGLLRLLQEGDEPLAVAILSAFARIGDHTVLKHVERLATGRGRAATQPAVQKSAQNAVAAIQMRLVREEEARNLLRASYGPAMHENLLHPHSGMTENEIQFTLTILRQMQNEPDVRALPYAARLYEMAGEHRVREAARQTMLALQTHVQNNKNAQGDTSPG